MAALLGILPNSMHNYIRSNKTKDFDLAMRAQKLGIDIEFSGNSERIKRVNYEKESTILKDWQIEVLKQTGVTVVKKLFTKHEIELAAQTFNLNVDVADLNIQGDCQMIDFQNKKVFKLSKGKEKNIPKEIFEQLIPEEEIAGYYTSIRDYVVFTNKRIIACNVQGMTGSKKDFSSLPYSKIQAYSIETAGTFDMDSELTVCFSGLGNIKFDFSAGGDIKIIGQLISTYVL